VEDEKPYRMNLTGGTTFSGELRYKLENYFPDVHYCKAIQQAREQEEELVPDGGSRTQYYWSGEDGILYHTEKHSDRVNPFFETVEDAERFLEHQAQEHSKDRYESFVLRKTGNRKVKEAVEVLMDQSGIQDFL
jgi:hypothetical protein